MKISSDILDLCNSQDVMDIFQTVDFSFVIPLKEELSKYMDDSKNPTKKARFNEFMPKYLDGLTNLQALILSLTCQHPQIGYNIFRLYIYLDYRTGNYPENQKNQVRELFTLIKG